MDMPRLAGGLLDLVERPRNTFATTCPSPDPAAIHSGLSSRLRLKRDGIKFDILNF